MSDHSQKTLNILVFHIGHLGDSVMILPSMQVLKNQFPDARFTLLSDRAIGKNRVSARHVFANTTWFDHFYSFPKSKRLNAVLQAFTLIFLIPRLRLGNFDKVVYLTPSNRSVKQIERDRRLFKLCRIHEILGMDGFFLFESEMEKSKNPPIHEADLVLVRLKLDGLRVPDVGTAQFDLQLGGAEKQAVDAWMKTGKSEVGNRRLVAFAPGSKMPAKRWALANFAKVGQKLVEDYNIFPIVFGGAEDNEMAAMLIKSWRRGLNACGALSVRQAAEALSRCTLYIGNDTGTMHLAAAVKTPCLAIFSARDVEGKWFPYGGGHLVFREHIKCQGCMLEVCDHKSCLKRISPRKVLRGIKMHYHDILTAEHDDR